MKGPDDDVMEEDIDNLTEGQFADYLAEQTMNEPNID